MACREFSLWYNGSFEKAYELAAMACREFSLWYNFACQDNRTAWAMACREFSLWYNSKARKNKAHMLWLVGNSRYGTMTTRLQS